MPYQETLKEARWVPAFADGWEGDPWKSQPKEGEPQVLAGAISSATMNTIRMASIDTAIQDDFDSATKLRAFVLTKGARDWRNIKDRHGADIPFTKDKRHDGPSLACLAELEGRCDGPITVFMQVAVMSYNTLTEEEAGN